MLFRKNTPNFMNASYVILIFWYINSKEKKVIVNGNFLAQTFVTESSSETNLKNVTQNVFYNFQQMGYFQHVYTSLLTFHNKTFT